MLDVKDEMLVQQTYLTYFEAIFCVCPKCDYLEVKICLYCSLLCTEFMYSNKIKTLQNNDETGNLE